MAFFVGDEYAYKILGKKTTRKEFLTGFKGPKWAARGAWEGTLFKGSLKESLHWSVFGNQIMLPLVAYSASKAQRGEMLATFGSEVIGWGTHGVLSLATTAALHLVPGFGMLPVGARAAIGSIAAGIVNTRVTERIHKGFTLLNSAERRIQRLEFGGDCQDTETASAMRMAAVRDMNSTMGARRRFLGNEALYFHG
jgi:hypothetical protein